MIQKFTCVVFGNLWSAIFFSLNFMIIFCPIGISSMGNPGRFPSFPEESRLQQSRATQTTCWVFSFNNSPNSDMECMIFAMCSVIALRLHTGKAVSNRVALPDLLCMLRF